MAFAACRREAAWFDAVARNNLVFVRDHVARYKRQYDARAGGRGVHKGWAAIHYACALGHAEAFRVLLPHEYDLLTDYQATVAAPGAAREVVLDAGSSIVHQMVVLNRVELMRELLQAWREQAEYKNLAGCKNDSGDSAMLVAVRANTDAGYLWCCNEKVVRNEIKMTNNARQNFVHLVCLYGRTRYVDWLRDMLGEQKLLGIDVTIDKLKETLVAFLRTRDGDQRSWLELCQKDNECCTREEKDRVQAGIQAIVDEL